MVWHSGFYSGTPTNILLKRGANANKGLTEGTSQYTQHSGQFQVKAAPNLVVKRLLQRRLLKDTGSRERQKRARERRWIHGWRQRGWLSNTHLRTRPSDTALIALAHSSSACVIFHSEWASCFRVSSILFLHKPTVTHHSPPHTVGFKSQCYIQRPLQHIPVQWGYLHCIKSACTGSQGAMYFTVHFLDWLNWESHPEPSTTWKWVILQVFIIPE